MEMDLSYEIICATVGSEDSIASADDNSYVIVKDRPNTTITYPESFKSREIYNVFLGVTTNK